MSALPLSDIQPFARRGVCPALSAPMQTGDGLLSRVAFTGYVSPQDFVTLCALATRHGNGLVDITARGGLQFRGLTAQSATGLERDVLQLGLPIRQGLAVETSPLVGVDQTAIADTRNIVHRIRLSAEKLGLHDRLAAKMSVIVDGGGHVSLSDLLADIRLKAVTMNGEIFWQLTLGGAENKALKAGLLRQEHAACVVIDLLSHLAASGPDARGRDLNLATVRMVCGERLLDHDVDVAPHVANSPYGLMPLGDGFFAAGLAPAFGQISAEMLASLFQQAVVLGLANVRPGPSHSLIFCGREADCRELLAYAATAGFVTMARDPRSAIAVCPGAPACGSAFMPTHALADHAAAECGSILDGSFTLHLSGCAKGCAHPSPALLAFHGRAEGLAFGLSARVGDPPTAVLPIGAQKAALSRLAQLYEKEHKPGENARAFFSRLGSETVSALLQQDN
ncbi:precorrin-3B synthase [Rhizobium sp. BIGb0125]|uniref:precorrin-3B synthase n=1 Tax=Rhizobium sp. BIGb0125 TaxID=2940618 RepID=UPI00216A2965|nr:precorrin-3B synthase [Rhizobium sp. BIGb0125]MCS4244810.1 precorrin-3B synthase [Rhizobium sp. BIGb0125]